MLSCCMAISPGSLPAALSGSVTLEGRIQSNPTEEAIRPKARTTRGKRIQPTFFVARYNATPRIIAPIFSAAVDSKRSAPRPAQSPTLSPTRSAITGGCVDHLQVYRLLPCQPDQRQRQQP